MGNNPSLLSHACFSDELAKYPWYPPDEEGENRIGTIALTTHLTSTCFHCNTNAEHIYTTAVEAHEGAIFRRVYHFCTLCHKSSTCAQVLDANKDLLEMLTTYHMLLELKKDEKEKEKENEEDGKADLEAGKVEEKKEKRVAPVVRKPISQTKSTSSTNASAQLENYSTSLAPDDRFLEDDASSSASNLSYYRRPSSSGWESFQ